MVCAGIEVSLVCADSVLAEMPGRPHGPVVSSPIDMNCRLNPLPPSRRRIGELLPTFQGSWQGPMVTADQHLIRSLMPVRKGKGAKIHAMSSTGCLITPRALQNAARIKQKKKKGKKEGEKREKRRDRVELLAYVAWWSQQNQPPKQTPDPLEQIKGLNRR